MTRDDPFEQTRQTLKARLQAGQDGFERTRYSLIQRLQNWDDQESWEDFYDLYKNLIYGVAIRAGLGDAEAHDVLQETVVTVAKNIHKFDRNARRGTFKGWLMNTTKWRVADQYRKRKGPLYVPPPDTDQGAGNQPELPDEFDFNALWEAEWGQHLIEEALDRVRPRVDPTRYQMFDLHVLKEWKAQRVAEMFRVTLNQVYAAKYKVEELLAREVLKLREQESDSTARHR